MKTPQFTENKVSVPLLGFNNKTVSFVALWESKTNLRGINAANGTHKGIDAVSASAAWKDMTAIINATYIYDATLDNGFCKLHDGELVHGGAMDATCSVKNAVSGSPRHHYIASYGVGQFGLAAGDVPGNAQEGSAGMAQLASSVEPFTSIARVTVGTERLFILGSHFSKFFGAIPYNDYITAVKKGSSATILLDPDGGSSCALSVADPGGTLKTKVSSPRHWAAGIGLPYIKTYLGFKATKPWAEQ